MFAPTWSWPLWSGMLQDPGGTELPDGGSIDYQITCAGVLYVYRDLFISAGFGSNFIFMSHDARYRPLSQTRPW